MFSAPWLLSGGALVLLLVLLGYAYTNGDFDAGLDFLFRPDFEKLFIVCQEVAGEQRCEFSGSPVHFRLQPGNLVIQVSHAAIHHLLLSTRLQGFVDRR